MALPTARPTAEFTAEALITKWVPLMGLFDNLICDNGTHFKNKLISNIAKRLQINMRNTAPYNPRCNGLVEVTNKLLGSMLFRMTNDKPNEWNRYLDFVMSAYNSSIHTSTNYAPNYLVFGRHLMQPVDAIFGFEHNFLETKGWAGWDMVMKQRIDARDKAMYQAYQNNATVQLKTSKASEGNGKLDKLKTGDKCAVAAAKKLRKECPPWDMNYVVTDQLNPSTFVVTSTKDGRKMTVNRRRLKLVVDQHPFNITIAENDQLIQEVEDQQSKSRSSLPNEHQRQQLETTQPQIQETDKHQLENEPQTPHQLTSTQLQLQRTDKDQPENKSKPKTTRQQKTTQLQLQEADKDQPENKPKPKQQQKTTHPQLQETDKDPSENKSKPQTTQQEIQQLEQDQQQQGQSLNNQKQHHPQGKSQNKEAGKTTANKSVVSGNQTPEGKSLRKQSLLKKPDRYGQTSDY